MQAIRQKCRPKHQVLILKCYPSTTKGAVDVRPNSSELSYLLFYATTRRSKVQKVGAFLEKKTASDVWRARLGNVQVTLQIFAALIEKAPRDLPLYAPYVLKILNIILRSRDITMVESSIPTFQAFCEHHDGASLVADQEYLHQYEEVVHMYAQLASPTPPQSKTPVSPPVAIRWRMVGLQAIRSVAASDALASLAGRQLHVMVPVLLENLWSDNEDALEVLDQRASSEEKTETEKGPMKRRPSVATVRTIDGSADTNPAALSGSAADVDKLAEEDIGVMAIHCMKQIFEVNNRQQISAATAATLKYIADRVKHGQQVLHVTADGQNRGWATKLYELMARWTPVQDRYVILINTMDAMKDLSTEEDLQQQLVLATMIDYLLKSDINLIGLSVMDVMLTLIQLVLRVIQLGRTSPPTGTGEKAATINMDLKVDLALRLQECVGDLATHVYYSEQISDMISAIFLRLKTSAAEPPAHGANADPASNSAIDNSAVDGFFSFDNAKIKALEAIKAILLMASKRKIMSGFVDLGRAPVSIRVWEGTQWLLRSPDLGVRKAYVDALTTWLHLETSRSDLRVIEDKTRALNRTTRDDSSVNLSRRAASNATRDKSVKPSRSSFLQLLHIAIYENALQYGETEAEILILHLLLAKLIENLGVNAVRNGLPMIFRLQEDVLAARSSVAKVQLANLCHGYFWALGETFDFESSPIGRAINTEIHRRREQSLWLERVRFPPMLVEQIEKHAQSGTKPVSMENLKSQPLKAFNDRYEMVTLISLSYSESLMSMSGSPPASPDRGQAFPLSDSPKLQSDQKLPDSVKEDMMAEWNKETAMATVQAGSKTLSLNGSRSATNATGHRNYLAVNGQLNDGTHSGQQSPNGINHASLSHRSRPNSTHGAAGIGALQKLRKGSAHSPGPVSDSSRNSITRVDQLKKVLSGQPDGRPRTMSYAHSDASSDSMMSYDMTPSEVSFNPGTDKPRSRSRDRSVTLRDDLGPLSSHKAPDHTDPKLEKVNSVPPVPPLPASLLAEGISIEDHAAVKPATLQSSRSTKRSATTKGKSGAHESSVVHDTNGGSHVTLDLQNLLQGIDASGGETADGNGDVVRPPY